MIYTSHQNEQTQKLANAHAQRIMSDYVGTRDTPNSPLILRRTIGSVKTFPPLYTENIDNSSFYPAKEWLIARQLLSSWKAAFADLANLSIEGSVSHDVVPLVLRWLVTSFVCKPNMGCPSIVSSGEGGADIEWSKGDIFVSIQIDNSEHTSGIIYFEQGEAYTSLALNEENLNTVLSQCE